MRRGDATLNPYKLIKEMRSPEFTQDKWREMLTRYQLDPAISLAPPSNAAPSYVKVPAGSWGGMSFRK